MSIRRHRKVFSCITRYLLYIFRTFLRWSSFLWIVMDQMFLHPFTESHLHNVGDSQYFGFKPRLAQKLMKTVTQEDTLRSSWMVQPGYSLRANVGRHCSLQNESISVFCHFRKNKYSLLHLYSMSAMYVYLQFYCQAGTLVL